MKETYMSTIIYLVFAQQYKCKYRTVQWNI